MVSDLGDLHVALFRNNFRARDVGIGVDAREDGVLRLAVDGILENGTLRIDACEIQHRWAGLLPRDQRRREVPQVELDSVGTFDKRKHFEHQRFVARGELKCAEHHAGFRRGPHLLRDARSPRALPTSGEPRKVRERGLGWRSGRGRRLRSLSNRRPRRARTGRLLRERPRVGRGHKQCDR